MKPGSLQKKLLDLILGKYPKRSLAVGALRKLLGVSTDSVYRRLRGETLLSPDEISLLAQTYQISIDLLIHQKEDKLLFSFNAFEQEIVDFDTYMDQLLFTAEQVRKLQKVEIYYTVQELSIFLLPLFPHLFSFRLYVYGLTYWKFDYLQDTHFQPDLVPDSVFQKALKVNAIYNAVTSHELWDLSLIDNTLNQIEYLATTDRFKNLEQVKALCEELMQVMDYLRTMATSGNKFALNDGPGKAQAGFDLYYNEFASTNDSLLVSSPDQKLLFTSFGSPDFLSTNNQFFCNHLESWFKTIISRSTSISTHSERKRDWFFRHLEKKIRSTREKIEVSYDY